MHGNFIGTNATGTAALGNSSFGVSITVGASNNTIGGATAGATNVISGNALHGVFLSDAGTTGNLVQGNFIGTDVTGTAPVGNIGDGIEFRNASGNTTGGTLAGAGNTIAFNGGDGVAVFSGKDNAILGNSIFSNGGLGIDLIPDAVTPNDSEDADAGANDLQNFPTLTSATNGSSTTVAGTLDSTPGTDFRIEFFSSNACDASGHGEGESFIGQITEATDGNGNLAFMSTFPVAVPVGRFITATATDPAGNTSEFSLCVQVTEASPGDVNGDGKVNSEDLRLIAANLGTRPPDDPRADVDGDGMVDARDLAAVAISFGRPGPAPVADGIIDGNDPALPASNQGKVESPYQVR